MGVEIQNYVGEYKTSPLVQLASSFLEQNQKKKSLGFFIVFCHTQLLKKVKYFENKTMNGEMEIEQADKNLRETTKMASDNEQKLDEITRKLGVQEDELKRANERAELAEKKLKDVEQELEAVGEKLKDKIHQVIERLKVAEARYEYGEMNVTKLNH